MITDDLLLVLKNFQGVREEQGENEKLRNLAVQFMNVAENIYLAHASKSMESGGFILLK